MILILATRTSLKANKKSHPALSGGSGGGTVALMGSVNKKDGHRRAMIHDHKNVLMASTSHLLG